MDAQLPPALARRIQALGHTAEHVFDRDLTTATDDAVRTYAESIGAVIVSKDEDFAVFSLLRGGPPVVWVRLGNTRKAELLRRMEADFGSTVTALERGEGLIDTRLASSVLSPTRRRRALRTSTGSTAEMTH